MTCTRISWVSIIIVTTSTISTSRVSSSTWAATGASSSESSNSDQSTGTSSWFVDSTTQLTSTFMAVSSTAVESLPLQPSSTTTAAVATLSTFFSTGFVTSTVNSESFNSIQDPTSVPLSSGASKSLQTSAGQQTAATQTSIYTSSSATTTAEPYWGGDSSQNPAGQHSANGTRRKLFIALGSALGAVAFLALTFLISYFLLRRRRRMSRSGTSERSNGNNVRDYSPDIPTNNNPHHRRHQSLASYLSDPLSSRPRSSHIRYLSGQLFPSRERASSNYSYDTHSREPTTAESLDRFSDSARLHPFTEPLDPSPTVPQTVRLLPHSFPEEDPRGSDFHRQDFAQASNENTGSTSTSISSLTTLERANSFGSSLGTDRYQPTPSPDMGIHLSIPAHDTIRRVRTRSDPFDLE